MNKPKVLVIMATYNGEKYLKEQIDSILDQKEVDITLHIFDDISKDKTIDIINEYIKNHNNIKLTINEENKNYTYNFLDALFSYKDAKDYDYYAFSDQDDFWCDDKLITAINKLKEMKGGCSLYSSNLKVVNENLEFLNNTIRPLDFKFYRHTQLFYCLVTGCTAVFNNEFKNLVTQYYPKNLIYHDYWIGLIANYCKNVNYYYDNSPDHILYRQHGNNTSGKFIYNSLFNRIKHLFKGHELNFHILRLLLENFSEELEEKDKEIIEKFINYKKNKKFLTKNLSVPNIKRVKLKMFFNKYKEKNIKDM